MGLLHTVKAKYYLVLSSTCRAPDDKKKDGTCSICSVDFVKTQTAHSSLEAISSLILHNE